LGDIERPLNKRGDRQLIGLQAWLSSNNIVIDQVLCSPATRTQATHRGIEQALSKAPVEIVKSLYHGRMENYLEALWAQSANRIMVIGHNPTCDELTRYLTSPTSPAAEKLMAHHFGTATMAILTFDIDDWSQIGQASGTLTNLLRPRDLDNGDSNSR
jgi:phosphohistidine phosphatase